MKQHMAKLGWVPAHQRYELRCEDCGELLSVVMEEEAFPFPGDCDPPPTLGIHVKEEIKVDMTVGE